MLPVINQSVKPEMGDCLATIDIGRKEGAAVQLSGGGAGSPSNTMWPRPRPTSVPSDILIHVAVWHNRHGPKIGGCAFFGGDWVPISHNVAGAEAYLYAKFHLDPHNRLATIHQSYRQTDRTDRQMVAPKLCELGN